jgi:nucleoside-diphosphate-sugar epimerase
MTGGYGCIGSWVTRELVERGYDVWIFDLREDTHRLDLVLDPEKRSKVHFVAGDVSDLEGVRAAVERVEASHILHLAGLQTPTCRADPILGAMVNVIGTLAVFQAAVALKNQVQRVVYASSAAVHGPRAEGAEGGVGDEVRLVPLSHYGAYKVCNELNARVFWLDQGITSIGLRPWTVYGVGRDFGMTSEPTKAIKAVAVGRRYHISYGGLQDLQYVGDVAATFVRALEHPFQGADAFNLRGAVKPIETFVAALGDVVPTSTALVTARRPATAHTSTWTIRGSRTGWARSLGRVCTTASPRLTAGSWSCATRAGWTCRIWPEIARSWDEMLISSHDVENKNVARLAVTSPAWSPVSRPWSWPEPEWPERSAGRGPWAWA